MEIDVLKRFEDLVCGGPLRLAKKVKEREVPNTF